MMEQKLLVVCRNFWPEDIRLIDLCELLGKLGYRIDVLCGQPSGADGEFVKGYDSFKIRRETHEKMDIYRTVDVKRGSGSNIRLFLYYIAFPLAGNSLVKKLRNKKYDAVFIYQMSPVMMAGPGLRLAQKMGIPSYLYVAALWPQSFFDTMDVRSGLYRRFLYQLSAHYYKKANAIIVPSRKMHKYFAQENIFAHIVPRFPEDRFLWEYADDSLLEKFAGSFRVMIFEDPNERLDTQTILRTAARIGKDLARNIRFVVIGDGRDVRELEKLAGERDLARYFFFEGTVSAIHTGKYIFLADVLLHACIPSEAGEYAPGQMLVNYLAAAKPIIVYDQGEEKELVKTAGCGLASSAMDEESLAAAIMRIYSLSLDERRRLGENARRYQQEHFSLEENAAQIAAILSGQLHQVQEESLGIQSLWEPEENPDSFQEPSN